jgi:hypothetical protein
VTAPARSRTALLVVLLHAASGCSWAFMTRPPEVVAAPNYPLDCTSSRAAPVLDTICAAYFAVNGLVLAGAKTCDGAGFLEPCMDSGTKNGAIMVDVALIALCAISASNGYGYATRCGVLKDTNALCITGNEAACRQLNSTWSPPMKYPATFPAQPPTAVPPVQPTQDAAGCSKDLDCKGSRICERGACAEPAAPRAPASP